MTHQEIKRAVEQRPFRPFELRLADGQRVRIGNGNQVGIHPKTRKTVVVFEPDGSYRIIDVALVTELQVA